VVLHRWRSPLDRTCSSRLVFLSYRLTQGIYLSFAQQQAIILGDASGSFIHPFFIQFAQLVGCHFHRRYSSDNVLVELESTHLSSVLRALSSMKEETDPLSYIHAHWLVAMACVTTRNSEKAIKFMKEAARAVERNRDLFLAKLPGLSNPPVTAVVDYSEDLHERLGLLAHILCFRTYMSIHLTDSDSYPLPESAPGKFPVSPSVEPYRPLLDARVQRWILEKFQDILYGPPDGLLSGLAHLFQNYLPVSSIIFSRSRTLTVKLDRVSCPFRSMSPHVQGGHHAAPSQVAKAGRAVYIRTSVCLHARVFPHSCVAHVGTPTIGWLTRCSEVCAELRERVQSIARLISKFTAANDHDSCVSLRMCSVVCLSSLGEFYHILSYHPLWKLPVVAVKQHEQTMYLMSFVSKELMNENDMRHLPPYAGVSKPGPRFYGVAS
jgi:hypothetical protein